ncbi:type VI secretion system membrane subunit TssM [Rubrivivax gelatinosus]|nr:type VI secretion system membrane subunit TssM [Rubrivivax gelatinosus]
MRPVLARLRRGSLVAAALLLLVIGVWLTARTAGLGWALAAAASVGIVALCFVAARRIQARRQGNALDRGLLPRPAADAHEQALQQRLRAAVRTIRRSRMGQARGTAALYELPWYIVIGNPAAGKSSAILHSGLTFPFEGGAGRALRGVGGTRDCDWFFTSEGILLDTAGRYAVRAEDRSEWFEFLGLLRRTRPRAPIDGIVVAASLAELSQARGDEIVELARSLRSRVQELTEKLEVAAPVYVLFTKADLLPGFDEFFADSDGTERERVWGATLPFRPQAAAGEAAARFGEAFDELQRGLRERAIASLASTRAAAAPAATLGFVLEFAALKPALSSFITTLFDDNPYQWRPLLRGFYLTSALQTGAQPERATQDLARRFALALPARAGDAAPATEGADTGYFLRSLFTRVLLADRGLVRQAGSTNRRRRQAAGYGLAVFSLASALGGWSLAYLDQRRAVVDAVAVLDQAAALQRGRDELGARLEALERLQAALERLAAHGHQSGWFAALGLDQRARLEHKLLHEYFAGLRSLLVQPVAEALERQIGAFLAARARAHASDGPDAEPAASPGRPALERAPAWLVGAPAGTMAPAAAAELPPGRPSRFVVAPAADAEAAYNALKTYLMLAEPTRREPAHLKDQMTRHWRGWLDERRGALSDDELLQKAQAIAAFALARSGDPAFPSIRPRPSLVEEARQQLRTLQQDRPAEDRVYDEIRARAATRFAPVTVAGLLAADGQAAAPVTGSEWVPGAFTQEAWQQWVEPTIREAANGALQRQDWVLETSSGEDLSLAGSPDQIRQTLTERYRLDYTRAWHGFVQGVSLAPFANLDEAAAGLDRLADPTRSPLLLIVQTLHRQTAWDRAGDMGQPAATPASGVLVWLSDALTRRADDAAAAVPAASRPATGTLAQAFGPIARWLQAGDGPSPFARYQLALARLRTRVQAINQQGDPGPGARELLAATLSDSPESELGAALRLVDEMFAGSTPAARAALRPMLVRPLLQTFAVLLPPAEAELNRAWQAQVHTPYDRTLRSRYPFDPSARVEAAGDEIAQLFGPAGAIARFADGMLAPFVVRRGDSLTARTWGDLGLRLRPAFRDGLEGWLAAGSTAPGSTAAATTAFQLKPIAAAGLAEYTVLIDGQTLRYRNAAATWSDFVWPHEGGAPGVRISGTTVDGTRIAFVDAPGAYGLDRAFELATRSRLPDGSSELAWTRDGLQLRLQLRIVRGPVDAPATGTLRGLRLPAEIAGVDTPASAPTSRPATPVPTLAALQERAR